MSFADETLRRMLGPHCPELTMTLKQMLEYLYLESGMSVREICNLIDNQCTPPTLSKKLRAHDIPLRDRGGRNNVKMDGIHIPLEDYQSLQYKDLAKKYGVHKDTIWRYCRKYIKGGGGKVVRRQNKEEE